MKTLHGVAAATLLCASSMANALDLGPNINPYSNAIAGPILSITAPIASNFVATYAPIGAGALGTLVTLPGVVLITRPGPLPLAPVALLPPVPGLPTLPGLPGLEALPAISLLSP